jgi:phage terminase Nu1 subunit (DNA packaging protein)
MNKSALAQRFKVSTNTVSAWVRLGCPHKILGGEYVFSPRAVQSWRQEMAKQKPASASDVTFAEARRRKELALAELRELELRKKAGTLVEVEGVRREAFRVARVTRDHLLAVPDRIAGLLATETDQHACHQIVLKEITQALESLSDCLYMKDKKL